MDFVTERAALSDILAKEIKDKNVLSVMNHVPREMFVQPGMQKLAYHNIPLSIGFGQTISQPLIVALMTEALELTGKEKVLEVGTGSGYQTAILAELSRSVVTVERLPTLLEKAQGVLAALGYDNIEAHLVGDTLGWPVLAPYDAIMITSGAPRVPEGLMAQLKVNGRMIIPVGSRSMQELCRITKTGGEDVVWNLGNCRFVPLIGADAWKEENDASRYV
ncbi:protein-L-isoaspartate(D-aspartate) O-methyltransferase [Chloroflexota bacterium]